MAITVCNRFTRFQKNIGRLQMTLYPDLCTSCALYYFFLVTQMWVKMFWFFILFCFIYLLLFHKVHITKIYSLPISSPSIFPH